MLLTASSSSLPVLFLLELVLLNGEIDNETDGETDGDWEWEAGGTGESGGSGLFSSCSISFSSFISPGGSTLYLSQEWPFTLYGLITCTTKLWFWNIQCKIAYYKKQSNRAMEPQDSLKGFGQINLSLLVRFNTKLYTFSIIWDYLQLYKSMGTKTWLPTFFKLSNSLQKKKRQDFCIFI